MAVPISFLGSLGGKRKAVYPSSLLRLWTRYTVVWWKAAGQKASRCLWLCCEGAELVDGSGSYLLLWQWHCHSILRHSPAHHKHNPNDYDLSFSWHCLQSSCCLPPFILCACTVLDARICLALRFRIKLYLVKKLLKNNWWCFGSECSSMTSPMQFITRDPNGWLLSCSLFMHISSCGMGVHRDHAGTITYNQSGWAFLW